jgi:oleate hydratase
MKHRPSPAKGRRSPAETEAWILVSGTSSLASAFYLVKDAGVPASNVHILDSHGSIGEVVHRLGNSVGEYDQFAGYLPAPVGAPIEELLASIPSTNCRGRSVFDQVQNADMEEALNTEKGSPCYLVQNKQTYRRVSTTLSNLGLKHRLSLLRLMFKLEEHLGGCQIKDVLPPTFFRSPFWAIWSAQ